MSVSGTEPGSGAPSGAGQDGAPGGHGWSLLGPGQLGVAHSLPGSLPAPAALPFGILTLVNTPYKRGFYCGDESIRYPYRPDTITHGLMAGVIITATVILVSRAC